MSEETPSRTLDPDTVAADPLAQFNDWLDQARAADLVEPTAMALATADADGRPSVRMVLFKGLRDGGLCFYTNYESHKADDLAQNPQASVVFWWDRLERQVRVSGPVTRFAAGESDDYFHSRPRISQLAAYTSRQSRAVASRDEMHARLERNTARFAGGDVPCPAHWGGYRLQPDHFEFWQGQRGRFHDRVVYTPSGNGWRKTRLEP